MKLILSLPFASVLTVLAHLAAPGQQVSAAEVPGESEATVPPADQIARVPLAIQVRTR